MNIEKNPGFRQAMWISLLCLLAALLCMMSGLRREREALAARIVPAVLRFHVLADSDAPEDQQVKLEVRSLILDYIHGRLDDDSEKEDTVRWLKQHADEVTATADDYLTTQGFPYRSTLTLTREYFPSRVYDNFVFPCGWYDAVRVVLGNGKGHNWWCVLYPRFCFADAVCTTVPEESLALLEQKIGREDFLLLQDPRPDRNFSFQFRLFPGLSFYSTVASPATPQS
ncbi:MAG: stage II sporulation protein R [Clostridiales bacterium]|nr:stage II sporulation protein R [Clostridiales bacterium]